MTIFSRMFRRERHPEVRRALDVKTGKPVPYSTPVKHDKQWFQGRLTFLSLLISAAGAFGKMQGWEVPAEEVNGMLSWIGAHWDDVAQFFGLAAAAYGRLRLNWRHQM